MTEPFDWQALECEFQEATSLPGANPGDDDWWNRWHEHVATRSTPGWFYDPATSPDWFNTHWPALSRRWVEAGEGLLTDLVHAGDFRPGRLANGDINWAANPTRSMSWAGFHYWSWSNPLMRAYALTGDERYPAEFALHLKSYFEQLDTFQDVELWDGAPQDRDWNDWITHNDLSAGIKMAAFGEAVMVFRGAAVWSADDLRRATLILLRLARRLYDTYSDTRLAADLLRTLNFLTSGAAGLGTVAAIFPECAWSANWLGLAQRILEVHLAELYYPDGGHRELCTQYHKAGLRDMLFLEQILARQGTGFLLTREPYRRQVVEALRFLTRVRMPDGTTSVLNSAAASDDWLVFCAVANRQLHDPELAWHIEQCFAPDYVPRQKGRPALCVRILGDGDGLPDGESRKPQELSVYLPDSGVAVLRDGWDRWGSTMVIDYGRPVGGHAYPARGSFSLYLRGRPACLSPGSPHAYTDPDYLGWMHTSRSQNAVLIDDTDQEQWEQPGLRRVHGEILHWETDADSTLVQGRHPGYMSNLGILCTRTVLMVAGRFFIVHDVVDAIDADAEHEARWSIHCPEEISEQADRVGLAPGLMRIVPAWPDEVTAVELGSEGKAVYPGPSEDGTTDELRPLHQARWRMNLPPGEVRQFLMLLQPDGEPAQFSDIQQSDAGLSLEISMGGVRDRFLLPPTP
ncbi:MAG: alginate lyase family protein [Gemmatimonadetes bacterium]|nr:alginate lyase family protein [Gemmatimonadota bacterium]